MFGLPDVDVPPVGVLTFDPPAHPVLNDHATPDPPQLFAGDEHHGSDADGTRGGDGCHRLRNLPGVGEFSGFTATDGAPAKKAQCYIHCT